MEHMDPGRERSGEGYQNGLIAIGKYYTRFWLSQGANCVLFDFSDAGEAKYQSGILTKNFEGGFGDDAES